MAGQMDKGIITQKKERYHKLLSYLNNRFSIGDPHDTKFQDFMLIAKTHLQPRQLSSNDFLKICGFLDNGGILRFDKLNILLDVFTKDKDESGYNSILEAQRDIENIGELDGDGGSEIFYHRTKSPRYEDNTQEKRTAASMKASKIPPSKRDQNSGKFHKEEDNSFFFSDIRDYVMSGVNASIGVINVDKSYGTCFRVGERHIMTADHVVEKAIDQRKLTSCTVKFDMQGESDHFTLENSVSFRNKEHDIVILKISGDKKLPEPLVLDRTPPPKTSDVFGYPETQKLRVDLNCYIYTDDENLKYDIAQANESFWRHKASYDENGCYPPVGRTAMHTSRSFEHGASGSPIMRLENGKPVVTMMYQGGRPKLFYDHRDRFEGENAPLLSFRFEYGITMKKVSSLIDDIGNFDLNAELFG